MLIKQRVLVKNRIFINLYYTFLLNCHTTSLHRYKLFTLTGP